MEGAVLRMTVALILILIILLIIIVCFIYIKTKVERFSQKWFGTKDFFEGINKRKLEMDETPKTPFGMDSLLLPEIQKDFPNLNINEMKKVAENNITLCFESIESLNLKDFENTSEVLKNNLQGRIDDLKEKGSIKIGNMLIHKTVINKYDREESKCRIVFQSSVSYQIKKNGEVIKKADRINTEFIYIYNYKNIESHESISLKCPNCGGPIQSLGVKVCPYCNSGIIDLASKTWVFNDIKIAS